MTGKYTVKLTKIVEAHELTVVVASSDYESYEISTYDVSRPGLPLAGFFGSFKPEQVHIIGQAESDYLRTLDPAEREGRLDGLFSHRPKVVVVCSRVPPETALVSAAKKYDCSLLTTDIGASQFTAQIINTLRTHLAPRETIHGVLMEVHGEGLLIIGDSGVGKSETAIGLINRGHRIVADDSVEIRRMNRNRLMGVAPEMIRYLMELRGIGLIDVRTIFGVGAVLEQCSIDLVVEFVPWEQGAEYDRLGLSSEHTSYLGVRVPKVVVPVAPGRNLAAILEVAAINNRQKKMGINTAELFVQRYDSGIDSGGF